MKDQALPLVRQIVFATNSMSETIGQLPSQLRLDAPYADPLADEFGVESLIFSIGSSFLEFITPIDEQAPSLRFLLQRNLAASAYMLIFQVVDITKARNRVTDLGVRVVWSSQQDDMASIHLHPTDTGTLLLSLDAANPPTSWRWAGPDWIGGPPDDRHGGILELTIASDNPLRTANRWSEVLGLEARKEATIMLGGGAQALYFARPDSSHCGITSMVLSSDRVQNMSDFIVAGVHCMVEPTSRAAEPDSGKRR